MVTMLFTWKFTTCISILFIFYVPTTSGTASSGPFRSYVYTIQNCSKPMYPWHPNPTIALQVEVYNHSTEGSSLRGSFDVFQDTTGVKLKTKSMIWEHGKWKTNFALVDNGCRGSLLPFWMSLFNIKFDKKKCAFLQCHVPFDIMNTNKIHHMITKTAEYGRVLFVNEMFMMGKQFKTLFCYEYEENKAKNPRRHKTTNFEHILYTVPSVLRHSEHQQNTSQHNEDGEIRTVKFVNEMIMVGKEFKTMICYEYELYLPI